MRLEEAKRGVRVRCVNDHFVTRSTDPIRVTGLSLPKEGQVYTIREAVQAYRGEWGIRFLEIKNPILHHDIGGNQEATFSLDRFEVVP